MFGVIAWPLSIIGVTTLVSSENWAACLISGGITIVLFELLDIKRLLEERR